MRTPTDADIRPLLRWAGSKRQLVPRLVGYVPPSFDRYIEPFAGSACLFAALRPRTALLGDLNSELIDTYRTVAEFPVRVADKLVGYPVSTDAYYNIRRIDPLTLPEVDRAARFIYLNRLCFNGVYRTNRRGQFNVPKGSKTGSMPGIDHLRQWSDLLKRATLLDGDFEKCIEHAQPGDFVYLDPPYTLDDCRYRGEYGYGSFHFSDLDRLAAALTRLDHIGAKFLLSYRCKKVVRDRFAHWNQRRLDVRRHVSGFSQSRGMVRELIISNAELRCRASRSE